jgi:hypothetical protein
MTVDELIATLRKLRSRVGGDTPVEVTDDYLMISEVSIAHCTDGSTSIVIYT